MALLMPSTACAALGIRTVKVICWSIRVQRLVVSFCLLCNCSGASETTPATSISICWCQSHSHSVHCLTVTTGTRIAVEFCCNYVLGVLSIPGCGNDNAQWRIELHRAAVAPHVLMPGPMGQG